MSILKFRNGVDSPWVEIPTIRGEDGISPTVEATAIDGGCRLTITDKNGSRTVDILNGADGKNAYQYAVEAGYSGTETEFMAELAREDYMLPLANADTLGGVKPIQKSENMTQAVGVDKDGRLFTVPLSDTTSDVDVIEMLVENDMLKAVSDSDGTILSDGENILIW